MAEATLDLEELAAIREAMGIAARTPPPSPVMAGEADAAAIALIADDRAAERARPCGVKLGGRWAQVAARHLQRLLALKLDIQVRAVDMCDGEAVREELAGSWLDGLVIAGRNEPALIAAGGQMVEALAARLLGDVTDRGGATTDRAPSATSVRLFGRVGDAFATSLAQAWRDDQGATVTPMRDATRGDALRRSFGPDDNVVVVTLGVDQPVVGWVKLIARPDALVPVEPPLEAVPASPGAIEEALGATPVEVRVDLGNVRMTMAQLAALRPGDVITLLQFVDDLLPVRCGGVVKAFGRAVVARGAIAVEISDAVAHGSPSR